MFKPRCACGVVVWRATMSTAIVCTHTPVRIPVHRISKSHYLEQIVRSINAQREERFRESEAAARPFDHDVLRGISFLVQQIVAGSKKELLKSAQTGSFEGARWHQA